MWCPSSVPLERAQSIPRVTPLTACRLASLPTPTLTTCSIKTKTSSLSVSPGAEQVLVTDLLFPSRFLPSRVVKIFSWGFGLEGFISRI